MLKPLSQFAGQYREWLPAGLLRDHVSRIWTNDLTHAAAEKFCVVPDGCVDIFWTCEHLCVAGPDSRAVVEPVSSRSCISGVRFYPGAACGWLGLPLAELLNSRVPLAAFWGREADRIEDRLHASSPASAPAILQQELSGRIGRVSLPDRQIVFLRRCAGDARSGSPVAGLRDLTRQCGVSERTLRRRCIDAFGYGFKTLQRVLRFQRLFRLAMQSPHADLADLAFDAGFADQAHMSREVQRMSGSTPAELVRHLSVEAGRFVQDSQPALPLGSPDEKNLRPRVRPFPAR